MEDLLPISAALNSTVKPAVGLQGETVCLLEPHVGRVQKAELGSHGTQSVIDDKAFSFSSRSSSPLIWMLSCRQQTCFSSPPSPNLNHHPYQLSTNNNNNEIASNILYVAPRSSSPLVKKLAKDSANQGDNRMQKKHSRERKFSDMTKKSLKTNSFDPWKWTHDDLISLLEEMYNDLGITEELGINRNTLHNFLLEVEHSYNSNPFHNFRHCFCVAQMMYVMIHGCGLDTVLDKLDMAVLITACICHDLDHPGLNNSYQINAGTELAKKFHNISPLENHHKESAFKILSHPETNIFNACTIEEHKRIEDDISSLILATDMSRHNEFVKDFESKVASGFLFSDPKHISSLKSILIKACDISNECRPIAVSEKWVDNLLEEYFAQSDLEKSEGLPFAPFMDREKVTKPESQIGFIKFVLIPLFEVLAKVLPEVETIALNNLKKSLNHYEGLKQKEENGTTSEFDEKAGEKVKEPLKLLNDIFWARKRKVWRRAAAAF